MLWLFGCKRTLGYKQFHIAAKGIFHSRSNTKQQCSQLASCSCATSRHTITTQWYSINFLDHNVVTVLWVSLILCSCRHAAISPKFGRAAGIPCSKVEGDWYILGFSSDRADPHSDQPHALNGSSRQLAECNAGGVAWVEARRQQGKQWQCLTGKFKQSSGLSWEHWYVYLHKIDFSSAQRPDTSLG